VIQGVCRYLVKDRMNLTEARWSLTSAEAVLRLRAHAPVTISMPIGSLTKKGIRTQARGTLRRSRRARDCPVRSLLIPIQPSYRSALKIVKKKGES
jgi:hypothetical protein